jgi:hypothetical protein
LPYAIFASAWVKIKGKGQIPAPSDENSTCQFGTSKPGEHPECNLDEEKSLPEMTARRSSAQLLWPAGLPLAMVIAFFWDSFFLRKILFMRDTFCYSIPLRAFAAQAALDGALPFWNPYSALGHPFLAEPLSALFYPLHFLFWVFPVIPVERIEKAILLVRGQKVMLDRDLAELYGVTTGNLNKAVKRNLDRFPQDFMFQLRQEEYESLRFQFGILERGWHSKYQPYAFTEQGVAMLSSVLHSKRAVQVNIEIMRVFVRLREMMATHKEPAYKLKELEERLEGHDEQIQKIFEAIRRLMTSPEPPRKKIGFEAKEAAASYGKAKNKGARKQICDGNL